MAEQMRNRMFTDTLTCLEATARHVVLIYLDRGYEVEHSAREQHWLCSVCVAPGQQGCIYGMVHAEVDT